MIIKRQKEFGNVGTPGQRKKVYNEIRKLRRERDYFSGMAKKFESPDIYKKFDGDVALIPGKAAGFRSMSNIANRKSREVLENFLKNNK